LIKALIQAIKALQKVGMQLQLFVIALLDGINFWVFCLFVKKKLLRDK
jgi:hypothetical protein